LSFLVVPKEFAVLVACYVHLNGLFNSLNQ
jgi:hypothetical protein